MSLATAARTTRGFTLLELVTVLIIVGLIGAATLPRMLDDDSWTERAYVDELSSALRYTQRVAIASDCHVAITVDSTGYSASLRADENACESETGAFTTPVLRGDRTPLSRTLPHGMSVSGSGTVVFARDGSIMNSVPPTFTIGPFTISLDRATGAVSVTL